jgi:hypothetical protein
MWHSSPLDRSSNKRVNNADYCDFEGVSRLESMYSQRTAQGHSPRAPLETGRGIDVENVVSKTVHDRTDSACLKQSRRGLAHSLNSMIQHQLRYLPVQMLSGVRASVLRRICVSYMMPGQCLRHSLEIGVVGDRLQSNAGCREVTWATEAQGTSLCSCFLFLAMRRLHACEL